jgi:hypothetical protein
MLLDLASQASASGPFSKGQRIVSFCLNSDYYGGWKIRVEGFFD